VIEKAIQRPMKRREVLAIYHEILDGRRRRFPNGFFDGDEGRRRAVVLTRYLIRHIAGIRLSEIPDRLNKEVFYHHKLTWMLAACFNWSPYLAIEAAYPGRFHSWQFNVKGMWQGKDRLKIAAEATRWMIEEAAGIPEEEIPRVINARLFEKHNLRGMLSLCFKGSLYRAVDNAYPGRFRPWEFNNVPKNFWRGPTGRQNAREAVRWVVENRLGIPPARIYSEVTYELLRRHGLGGMLTSCFSGSSIAALQHAFPEVPISGEARRKRRRSR
jgi:hypothetical protein